MSWSAGDQSQRQIAAGIRDREAGQGDVFKALSVIAPRSSTSPCFPIRHAPPSPRPRRLLHESALGNDSGSLGLGVDRSALGVVLRRRLGRPLCRRSEWTRRLRHCFEMNRGRLMRCITTPKPDEELVAREFCQVHVQHVERLGAPEHGALRIMHAPDPLRALDRFPRQRRAAVGDLCLGRELVVSGSPECC